MNLIINNCEYYNILSAYFKSIEPKKNNLYIKCNSIDNWRDFTTQYVQNLNTFFKQCYVFLNFSSNKFIDQMIQENNMEKIEKFPSLKEYIEIKENGLIYDSIKKKNIGKVNLKGIKVIEGITSIF